MKEIFSSATKIVFLLMTLSLITFTAMKIISGSDFFKLVLMVFSFYYGQKTMKEKLVKAK